MTCIKQMLSVLMDGIKDANMIMDYAELAEESGSSEHAEWFIKQAKKRIDTLDSIHEYVKEAIGLDGKIRDGDEIANALEEHLETQLEELQKRYEVLK